MEPPSKRQLRPTSSLPTTAEKYGEKFGLPEDLQWKLQNVGPKGRFSVAQGRKFDRTQSFPTIPNPSTMSNNNNNVAFRTTSEIHAQAEEIISKERLRAHELKPYSDTLDASTSPSSHQPGSSSSSPKRTLTFEQNSRKRRSSPAEPEEFSASGSGSVSDTEVEADDDDEDHDMPDLTFTSTSTDDFPPVFTSPKITQPELFASANARKALAMPSRPENGRMMKSLPGGRKRGLGKTVSAPVIGTMGWSGMEVDTNGNIEGGLADGFDVREWAASEEF